MGQQEIHEHEAPGSHGAGDPGGLIAVRSQSVKGKASGVPPPLTLCALPACEVTKGRLNRPLEYCNRFLPDTRINLRITLDTTKDFPVDRKMVEWLKDHPEIREQIWKMMEDRKNV